MNKKKVFAIVISLALIIAMTLPGTLAISNDQDSATGELAVTNEPAAPTPEVSETPAETPTAETTPAPEETPEGETTPEPGSETNPAPTSKPEVTPEGEAAHIEGCSDGCTAKVCACTCHTVPDLTAEDFTSMTDEELYAYVKQFSTDEELEAFLKQLPEERLNSLIAYAQAQDPAVVPETVVFTDAGPFMPAVTVERVLRRAARAAAANEESTDNGNGLELRKTATANDNGSYTIRMEAYTTGDVITTTKTVPVDIVLVLDQSGSMAYDFNGNSTSTDTARRQHAMKQAVNNFIEAVAAKYSAEADHRMAIVTFGSNAFTLRGWTYVNEAGKNTLQGKITDLPNSPSGATNVADGMTQAETLMGSDYSYTGTNTQRQKVVIVFTDGVPTTSTDFDTTVATNAIATAKHLKDGGATVYTIGIFNGADPDELHGEKWDYTMHDDILCTGEEGSYWGGSWVSSLFGSNDFGGIDIAAGNRFLNYLSSNSTDAESIGLERGSFNPGDHLLASGTGYKITQNFTKSANDYYLTAMDDKSLNKIFQTISENIQSANIDLGSETVVKDTVSPYFNLPADASGVKLYTADYNGTSFGADTAAPSTVSAKIENGAVSVTGFDFNANFVSDTVKSDGTYGKKLIIEFIVTPKDDFIGGNDVPTNDWQNTAVYDKDGTEVEKFADANTTPTVNVPINKPVFTVNSKTIYAGNSTAVSGLYTLPDTTGWQYDYVKVNVTAGAANVTGETLSPKDCTNYTVKVTYAPNTDGKNSEGTPNDMVGKSDEKTATVHVLKPTVTATVNDVQKYYGESYTLGNDANGAITVKWTDKTDGHTGIPEAEGTAPYTSADLYLAYSTEAFTGQSVTIPKHDFDVTVKVMKGNDEIEGAVITTTCSIADSGCTTSATDGKYTVHVKACTLTIAKSGGASDEPYVFNIMKDGTKYSEVTIEGNTSQPLYELPVGTYTIQEDADWSWRYSANNGSAAALSATSPTGTITCNNELNNPYWLNGFSTVVRNIFGVNPDATN
ncbi:MAG: VWA domain-containing protein [Christensenellales bacterium]